MTGNEIDNQTQDADAVLAAFRETPGAEASAWARRHPALARDFARAAAERRFGLPEASDAAVARVVSLGREALAARRPALSSLLAAADAVGFDPDSLAERLQVPFGVLGKLQRRLVDLESVPAALLDRLAETLRRHRDEIAAYLALPPQLAPGASYRADAAPTVGARESFADALASDPETTPEMQALWSRDAS